MNSKLAFFSLVAVCLWGQEVKADTFVDVSATQCDGCFEPNPPPLELDAQLKVKEVDLPPVLVRS